MSAQDAIFTGQDLVHAYTRAEAIADGYLVEAPEHLAREVGFTVPVAVTRSAFEDCIAWDKALDGPFQEESARFFDVLYMAAFFARAQARGASQFEMEVSRVVRGQLPRGPRSARLKVTVGPGDNAEPVITIGQLDED